MINYRRRGGSGQRCVEPTTRLSHGCTRAGRGQVTARSHPCFFRYRLCAWMATGKRRATPLARPITFRVSVMLNLRRVVDATFDVYVRY